MLRYQDSDPKFRSSSVILLDPLAGILRTKKPRLIKLPEEDLIKFYLELACTHSWLCIHRLNSLNWKFWTLAQSYVMYIMTDIQVPWKNFAVNSTFGSFLIMCWADHLAVHISCVSQLPSMALSAFGMPAITSHWPKECLHSLTICVRLLTHSFISLLIYKDRMDALARSSVLPLFAHC